MKLARATASLERKRRDETTSRFYGIDVRGCCERDAKATCELIYRFHGFEITGEHPLFITSAFSIAPRRAAHVSIHVSLSLRNARNEATRQIRRSILQRSFPKSRFEPSRTNLLLRSRGELLVLPWVTRIHGWIWIWIPWIAAE